MPCRFASATGDLLPRGFGNVIQRIEHPGTGAAENHHEPRRRFDVQGLTVDERIWIGTRRVTVERPAVISCVTVEETGPAEF